MFFDPSTLAPQAEAAGAEVGRAIWRGTVAGQNEGLPMVWKSAEDAIKFAAGGMEQEAEIHSPSKVFQRLGRNISEGLARGMEDGTPLVERSLPAPSADVGIGMGLGRGASGSRPIAISAPITVNYSGPGGAEAAGAIAAAVADILPGQLQHAFERIQTEMGTA
jgi:hypothetical protein